jgi:hypothetical protein
MISRLFPGLVAVIPVFALAQPGAGPDAEAADLRGWSLDELCGAREREDVRGELDRREFFSSRELRAIRTGEVKKGMSLGTLICVRGQPASIAEAVGRIRGRPLAAYTYLPGEAQGLVAYVDENSEESTVVHVLESEDPQAIVGNPNLMVFCSAPPDGTTCRMVDITVRPPSAYADSFPGPRCDTQSCDLDIRDIDDPGPLPPVPDDAR